MLGLFAALVFALSLCADCFAVAAASSVTLPDLAWRRVASISAIFAAVQTGFLLAGYGLGSGVVGWVGKFAPLTGFLLLAYVGGSMLVSGLRDSGEIRNLHGVRNVLIGAVATSIDAFAAGMSLSMDQDSVGDLTVKAVCVLIVTALSVVLGMRGGQAAGRRYGRGAQIAGGVVLLGIALRILSRLF